MMAKTFQSVFPHTSIWFAAEDIFMIGSLEKLEIDYDRLIKRISVPRIHNLLKDIDLEDPLEFLNTFIMNEDQVRMYTQGADVLTDSKPVIEYTGPRSLNVNTISPNLGEMLKYREPVTSYLKITDRQHINMEEKIGQNFLTSRNFIIGKAYLADQNVKQAVSYFKKALAMDPNDRRSIHYRQKLLMYWGKI
jgi:tetratricopeptide (TPR) repeat protein